MKITPWNCQLYPTHLGLIISVNFTAAQSLTAILCSRLSKIHICILRQQLRYSSVAATRILFIVLFRIRLKLFMCDKKFPVVLCPPRSRSWRRHWWCQVEPARQYRSNFKAFKLLNTAPMHQEQSQEPRARAELVFEAYILCSVFNNCFNSAVFKKTFWFVFCTAD